MDAAKELLNAPRIRVVMPYPNHGVPCEKTRKSLRALVDYAKTSAKFSVEVMELQGSSISVTRNIGITDSKTPFVKRKVTAFDYYLGVDADIAFTPSDVEHLIVADKDIISGAYTHRGDKDKIVAGHFNDLGIIEVCDFVNNDATGIRPVDWTGAGFLLIKARVFEAMDYPYFREEIINYTSRVGDNCAAWVGEDVGFCVAAKKAGFDVFVDCDCKVEHLTEKPLLTLTKENYTLEETGELFEILMEHLGGIFNEFYKKIKKTVSV